MTLKDIPVGQSAVIQRVGGEGSLRQHFLDMGVIPGAEVTVEKLAPMGDPMELQIHGYELTLRLADAAHIDVKPIPKRSRDHAGNAASEKVHHPAWARTASTTAARARPPFRRGPP